MINDYCIVTPFHKNKLDKYERMSLKSINKVFKEKKKFLVTFRENKLNLKGFENKYFDKIFLKASKHIISYALI